MIVDNTKTACVFKRVMVKSVFRMPASGRRTRHNYGSDTPVLALEHGKSDGPYQIPEPFRSKSSEILFIRKRLLKQLSDPEVSNVADYPKNSHPLQRPGAKHLQDSRLLIWTRLV